MSHKVIITLLAAILLASCGTQKTSISTGRGTKTHADPALALVTSVIDNKVNTKNITGNAAIRLQMGSQSMKLSGALRMRYDEVIRIQLQLPLIGTEVGRLEFTPDYVLVVDRMNKQYVKLEYSKVDFLEKNNISFYSLQALFWNELIAPSAHHASDAEAEQYAAELSATTSIVPVTLTDGKTKYQWQVNSSDDTISSALITYNGDNGTSMLTWMYSNFTSVGGKKFPRTQDFSFTTTINGQSQRGEIEIDMSEIKTSSDWDATTSLSSKYQAVSAEYIMRRLMSY